MKFFFSLMIFSFVLWKHSTQGTAFVSTSGASVNRVLSFDTCISAFQQLNDYLILEYKGKKHFWSCFKIHYKCWDIDWFRIEGIGMNLCKYHSICKELTSRPCFMHCYSMWDFFCAYSFSFITRAYPPTFSRVGMNLCIWVFL